MTTVRQYSFSSGELAPSLYARIDISKYHTGLRTCRNFVVMRHGGVTNRPGTNWIGEIKDSTKTIRLIKFVFNSSQTYVLEFGNSYIRIIKDSEYVSDLTLTITNISQASQGVLTYTGTDPSNGDQMMVSGVLGMTQVNNRTFIVDSVNTVANTFKLKDLGGSYVNTTGYTAYTSGGTAERIYTLSSPYVEADLAALDYVQSADIVTIVHRSYAPRQLSRSADNNWSLSTISFVPSISAPTGLAGPAGTFNKFEVTSVKNETFEESIASNSLSCGNLLGTVDNPINITWSTVSGAREYNVYRAVNEIYGLVGVAGTGAFADIGLDPDTTDTPPTSRNIFNSTDHYPGAVAYIQQRLMFASSNNDPETIWGSRTGFFHNFTITVPIQDDDSITFTMAGQQINRVKHLLDLKKPVIMTESGEWIANGDGSGALTPTTINLSQQTYHGSSDLKPIVIENNALYVQARGSIVRDLAFSFQSDGYIGNDLTIFSAHLFDKYTLVDWDYQQIPHSNVWIARNDGTLLGLTYIKEQQLLGWHRHDFDGTIENICVVPENDEDAVYMVIKRSINGRTVRYIERMYTRQINDIVDSVFVDCAETYDGRNTGSTTMTLSGGTNWDYTETLTCTASASTFSSTDVGKEVHITGSDGTIIRLSIDGYTSSTVVTGKPNTTVPVSMRSVAITDWALATATISGLWHIEGEDVSIFADGFVVASVHNPKYANHTVSNGSITLDRAYGVIHVGLPITSDLETLDIDTTSSESLADKMKNISRITANLEDSRGLWAGSQPPTDDDTDSLEGLNEAKIRDSEGYDEPVDLLTGNVSIDIEPQWNFNGRVFLRQIDPIPLTVLAIAPSGLLPFASPRGGYG